MPIINIYIKPNIDSSVVTNVTDSLISKSIEVFTHPSRKLHNGHFLVHHILLKKEDYSPNDVQLVFMLHDFEERLKNANENADVITYFIKKKIPNISLGTWILHGHFGKSSDTR